MLDNEVMEEEDQLQVGGIGEVPQSQRTLITLDKFIVPGEQAHTKGGIDQLREVMEIEQLRQDFSKKLTIQPKEEEKNKEELVIWADYMQMLAQAK